jgi:hypothetical protein
MTERYLNPHQGKQRPSTQFEDLLTEWGDTDTHWMRLEIPYPKTGGQGGPLSL